MRRISKGTGDNGTTALADGSRVSKGDDRVEAYGTLDELNSFLGLFLSVSSNETVKRIRQEIFLLGADISTPLSKKQARITGKHVERLNNEIEQLEKSLPEIKRFILPGGSQGASLLHISRTIARRAERSLAGPHERGEINTKAFVYLNRLSGLLFELARKVNAETGGKEEEVII